MENVKSVKFQTFAKWGLKIALALSFLSAVADRFGLWGAAGSEGVAWGNFENFTTYTKLLVPWAPAATLTFFAWSATVLELILGLLLLTNFKGKCVAFVSCALLFTFALSMFFFIGIKAPFDYSVFTAAFAALLLAHVESLEKK